MKQSEMMWGIFMATGNVDAYLLYLDYLRNEGTQDRPMGGGFLDL